MHLDFVVVVIVVYNQKMTSGYDSQVKMEKETDFWKQAEKAPVINVLKCLSSLCRINRIIFPPLWVMRQLGSS